MEYDENGKPCRACVSVEVMMKRGKEMAEKLKKNGEKQNEGTSSTLSSDSSKKSQSHGCPVDKDELGRSTWNLLHTISVHYPEKPTDDEKVKANSFMNLIGQLYPCDFCAKDLREDLKKDPPKLDNREQFSLWMCNLHNKVNKKIGKSEFDCKDVMQRWRDGWKDGSCDY